MTLYVCVGVSGACASIAACRGICGFGGVLVVFVGCFFCFRCLWLWLLFVLLTGLIVVNSVALCTLWFVCVLMFGVVGFRWVRLISIVRVFGFLLDCDGWILI